MMKFIAIIVAGGSGSRMGADIPKQFLYLDNKPILLRSLEKFRAAHRIILSIHSDYHDYWNELVRDFPGAPAHFMVAGGKTRYDSVRNALEAIHDNEAIVAVHDAVRPLVSEKLITLSFEAAKHHGTAIPVIPVEDTVREIGDDGSRVIDRSKLFRVQTPQSFELNLLQQAYKQPYTSDITDDASLVEKMGKRLHFIVGEKANIKLTEPDDLEFAKRYLGGAGL
jgi:2-C-methyl-D-erythritol 4-phosphate cytidylyltransferase